MLLRRFDVVMRCSRQCELKRAGSASEMRLRLLEKDAEKHAKKTGHVTTMEFDSHDMVVKGSVEFSCGWASRPHVMMGCSEQLAC